MEQFIVNKNALLIKNILVKDSIIFASDEDYGTKEVLLEKISNSKKSVLDTHYKISTTQISKFIPTESELAIQVFFTQNGKTQKAFFEFTTQEEFNQFKEYLIQETKFTMKNELQSSFASWAKKGAYTLLSTIIVGIIYFMARDIEKGSTVTISSGRRKGLKQLMKTVAESLGTTYTLILGIVFISLCLFWTYKAYVKGKKTIELYD